MIKKTFALAALFSVATMPAFAHPGHGTESFTTGFAHPLIGIDHIAVMVAVGLWATLKGGRALWAWPAVFVGVMLVGGALGMAHFALPLVEPGILASVVVLGLMVALAVDVPIAAGAALIGIFALLHGHAHGAEVDGDMGGIAYMAGFALATVTLHVIGIGLALVAQRRLVRLAGAACAVLGIALVLT
jgi:urease accessory protein